jgi:hypothetical protein
VTAEKNTLLGDHTFDLETQEAVGVPKTIAVELCLPVEHRQTHFGYVTNKMLKEMAEFLG